METLYTLTSLISTFIWSDYRRNGRCDNEYQFSEDRRFLTFTIFGTGDSIDYANPHAFDGWEENCMITQGFVPLEDDEYEYELDDGVTPMRTHSYKSVGKEITLKLPPNRKRGDSYTTAQIKEMVVQTVWLCDDIPGMGFSYYNVPDEEEVEE